MQIPVFSAQATQLAGQAVQEELDANPYWPVGQEQTFDPELYVAPV